MKIAYFMSDWDYTLIRKFIRGASAFSKKNPGVKIHIFLEPGKYGRLNPALGENVIFNLPRIEDYDGVILEGNQSWPGPERQKAADTIREKGIPVVAINYPLYGCTYVGTDNISPICDMVHYAVEKHGAKKLAFLRGLDRSKEAHHREQGFIMGCCECGINEENRRFIDGSWAIDSGAEAVKKLLAQGGELPDALICANDNEAYGAAKTLVKAGYRVPEDILVTGFDNLELTREFLPYLPTVARDNEKISETALATIVSLIKGEKVDQQVYSPYTICVTDGWKDEDYLREVRNRDMKSLLAQRNQEKFYAIQDEMEPMLLSASSLGQIMDAVENYFNFLGDAKLYIAVNCDYRYGNVKAEKVNDFARFMALTAIRGKDSEQIANPVTHIYDVFDRYQILPQHLIKDTDLLLILPLQFNETIIGYMALDKITDAFEPHSLKSTKMLLESAIENVRINSLLKSMNEKLADMSLKDQLTGLYNRYGMKTKGQEYYDAMIREQNVDFWFIDIDNMKMINDQYSHETGDNAIKVVGESINHISNIYGLFAMRFGGDEFVMFGKADSNEIENHLREMIGARSVAGYERQVEVSIGHSRVEKGSDQSLEQCLSAADEKMYEQKKARKSGKLLVDK